MISVTEARKMGEEDRADGLTADEMENIAESLIENFGGKAGILLSRAYRKGANL